MLERLLPAGAVVHEARGDLEGTLFAVEQAIVARAVEKRRREFTSGRLCARAALTRLGVEPGAIPAGPRGAPQWPPGVVGSITHCEGFRACAVARASRLAAVGVDAELDAPLPPGLLADIALPVERERLARLATEEPRISWDRLLFSAKESVYKAWFPLAGRWLGFEDAELTIDRRLRSFSARLLVPGPQLGSGELTGFEGAWLVGNGLILTAIALSATHR